MKRRKIALAMAAALTLSVSPLRVLADTYYIDEGSITVEARDDGHFVTQNDSTTLDYDVVITQNRWEATENTITLKSEGDHVASVTIKDLAIVAPESAITVEEGSAYVTVEGTNRLLVMNQDNDGKDAPVDVGSNNSIYIDLDGSLIVGNMGGTGAGIGTDAGVDMEAIVGEDGTITPNVTVTGDGFLSASSGYGACVGSGEGGDMNGTVYLDVEGALEHMRYTHDGGAEGSAIGSGNNGTFDGTVYLGSNTMIGTTSIIDGIGYGRGGDAGENALVQVEDGATLYCAVPDGTPAQEYVKPDVQVEIVTEDSKPDFQFPTPCNPNELKADEPQYYPPAPVETTEEVVLDKAAAFDVKDESGSAVVFESVMENDEELVVTAMSQTCTVTIAPEELQFLQENGVKTITIKTEAGELTLDIAAVLKVANLDGKFVITILEDGIASITFVTVDGEVIEL